MSTGPVTHGLARGSMRSTFVRFMRKPFREKAHALGTALRLLTGASDVRSRLHARQLLEGPMALPAVVLGRSPVYIAHRPDFDLVELRYPELRTLAGKWVVNNAENNSGDLPRLYSLVFNITQAMAEGVEGDFAELGVYKGNSAATLAHYARLHGRTLHLFDTFEGFDARDLRGTDAEKGLHFEDTALATVQQVVGMEAVNWVAGYFPASVPPQLHDRRFAVVHLDCDLHDPMQAGLEFFYPRLAPGGLLIIHDYHNPSWEGVRAAVDRFLAHVPERLVLLPDKSGTAVLRRLVSVP